MWISSEYELDHETITGLVLALNASWPNIASEGNAHKTAHYTAAREAAMREYEDQQVRAESQRGPEQKNSEPSPQTPPFWFRPLQLDFTNRPFLQLSMEDALACLPASRIGRIQDAIPESSAQPNEKLIVWWEQSRDGKAFKRKYSPLGERLFGLLPAIAKELIELSYNVVVTCPLIAQWRRQIAFQSLRNHVQPHVWIHVRHHGAAMIAPIEGADATTTTLDDTDAIVAMITNAVRDRYDHVKQLRKPCPVCESWKLGLHGWNPQALYPNEVASITQMVCSVITLEDYKNVTEAEKLARALQDALDIALDEVFVNLDRLVRLAIEEKLHNQRELTGNETDAMYIRVVAAFVGGVVYPVQGVMFNVIMQHAFSKDKLTYDLHNHNIMRLMLNQEGLTALTIENKRSNQRNVKMPTDVHDPVAQMLRCYQDFRDETRRYLDLSVFKTVSHARRIRERLDVLQEIALGDMSIEGDTDADKEQYRLEMFHLLGQAPQLAKIHLKIGQWKRLMFGFDSHLASCFEQLQNRKSLHYLAVDAWDTGDAGQAGHLDDDYIRTFYRSVGRLSQLTDLKIFAVSLPTTIRELIGMLTDHPTLRRVTLDQCELEKRYLEVLATYLRQPSCKLTHLTVRSNYSGVNLGGRVLLSALADNTSLVSLRYQDNEHDMRLLDAAGDAMVSNRTLQQLRLSQDPTNLGAQTIDAESETPYRYNWGEEPPADFIHASQRFWGGEVPEREAFAKVLEEHNHTLLETDVFDEVKWVMQVGSVAEGDQIERGWRVGIPFGQAVMERNRREAGHGYMDESVHMKMFPASAEY